MEAIEHACIESVCILKTNVFIMYLNYSSGFGGSRGSRMKRGRGSGRISQHTQHIGKQKLVDQTGWFRIFVSICEHVKI
jgi:hypothetical protein